MLDNSDPTSGNRRLQSIHWPQAVAVVLLVAGVGLVGWSFVGSDLASSRAAWSEEQARDYQASAIKLHGLSHEHIHAAEHGDEQAVEAELEKAQAEYDALLAQLESAMQRPQRIAWLMRIGGVLMLAAAAAILFLPSKLPARDH